MEDLSTATMSAAELASLLHFYRDAGVDWLANEEPVDRIAEFANRQQAVQAGPVASANPTSVDAGPPATQGTGRQRPDRKAPEPVRAPPPVIPDGQAVRRAHEIAAKALDVGALEQAFADFEDCNLKNSARSTVFLDGNRASKILLIGPVASAEDDRDGRPFSGPQGELLDRMLKAIGLSRDDVLLANSVPWRPPGSRSPTNVEADICRAFIERLIALVQPKVLLLLGNFPARLLIDQSGTIHGLRGRWFELVVDGRAVPTLATLHPADILQAPLNKPLVWRDLLMFRMALTSQSGS